MAEVVKIRDYKIKKLERDGKSILGQVVELPKVDSADPWAGRHCPGGIDDLPYMAPDGDCA